MYVVIVVRFALVLLISSTVSAGRSVDASPVTVFKRGENGYFCVKIPVLVYLESGTILAFGEGAKIHAGTWYGASIT